MHWIRLRFVKNRFVKYRFVRYWFRFVSRPWLDADITNKPFVCPQDVFKTFLQDVFSVTVFRLPRRLEDVLKTCSTRLLSCLQEALEKSTPWKPKNYYAEDVLKRLQEMSWRRLQDVMKTSKYFLEYESCSVIPRAIRAKTC